MGKMKLNKKVSSSSKKQRKAFFNATASSKTKQLRVPLSKDMQDKHQIRRIAIRPNDEVFIRKGGFKKKQGKVVKVIRQENKVFIEGCDKAKKEGGRSFIGVHVSKLVITRLTEEKDRAMIIEKMKN